MFMRETMRRSLRAWLAYFEGNALGPNGIPWGIEDRVSTEEIRLIGRSVAAFQLGEYSEGRGLLKSAEDFSAHFGDRVLYKITELFIREEQQHALLLKRFMLSHGMTLLKKQWTDTVFRRLRKLFGYELSVTVLITAEIIALVYYQALKNCTGSKILKAVCDKILADERAHVRFESELLLYLRGLKSAPRGRAVGFLHRFLYAGTVAVVYLGHRKVLARGGYGPAAFWKSCWLEFSKCFTRSEPALREATPTAEPRFKT
jgi:hypothetical protein